MLPLFYCSFCYHTNYMQENKCGGRAILTSDSVAQKTVKFKFGLCNSHSHFIFRSLKNKIKFKNIVKRICSISMWLRSLHTFYSLLKFLKNLWTLILGNPFYLSNWRMRYSRMTWHLLVLAKYLALSLQIKTQISCSLKDIFKYLPRPYIIIHDKTFHICLLHCVEFVQILWPRWEMFHAPKIKLTYMPQ